MTPLSPFLSSPIEDGLSISNDILNDIAYWTESVIPHGLFIDLFVLHGSVHRVLRYQVKCDMNPCGINCNSDIILKSSCLQSYPVTADAF